MRKRHSPGRQWTWVAIGGVAIIAASVAIYTWLISPVDSPYLTGRGTLTASSPKAGQDAADAGFAEDDSSGGMSADTRVSLMPTPSDGSSSDRSRSGSSKAPKDKPKPPKGEDPEDPPVDPEDPPADPEDPPADPEDPPVDPEDPPATPGVPGVIACASGDMKDVVTFELGDGGPVTFVSLLRATAADGPYSIVATAAPEAGAVIYPVTETGSAYYALQATGPGGDSLPSDCVDNGHVLMSELVTPEGRVLASSNGEVVLSLPPGAFTAPTTVSVTEVSASPTGGLMSLSGVYEITPSGSLGAPASLSVRYTLSITHFQVVQTLLNAAELMTYDAAAGSWVAGASGVTADGTYLTGWLDHFSYWTGAVLEPHGTNETTYCSDGGICHDLTTYAGSSVQYATRDSQVCYNCHGNTAAGLPAAGATGPNVQEQFYQCTGQTRPGGSTIHPVASGDLYCTICHDPHADPAASPALLRSWNPLTGTYVQGGSGLGPGDDFCWTCHGPISNKRVNYYVPNYWANTGGDRKTGYTTSAHAQQTTYSSVTCTMCHSEHGAAANGLIPGRQFSACTGATGEACHSDPANASGGSNIKAQLTAGGANDLTHHDVDPAAQTRSGAGIECTSCHNVHRDSATAPVSDPDNLQVSMTLTGPPMLDANGSAWMRVGAEHDGVAPVISAASIVGGPTTYLTPTVSWTTNEGATTWIDWGLTVGYEQTPYGNNTLTTTHSVTMTTPLVVGTTYYWRIRTTDALGNTSYSTGTYVPTVPPPAPVMSDETTFTGTGYATTAACELNASTVQANPPSNGVQYQFSINGVADGVWRATPVVTVYLHTGTYTVQVQARDATRTYARSAWSAADTFVVENADPWTGSCPFVFSWDGDSFSYENELYTTGKLGAPRASGTFQKPNPNDYCVLDTDLQPKDGKLELRLVEEIYETDYLDEVRLYAIDVPVGQSIAAEKIPQGGVYEPIESIVHPVSADPQSVPAIHVQTGADVTAELAESDDVYVTLNENKELPAYQTIELDLGDLSDAPAIKLLFEGATRFPRTEAGKLLGTSGVRQKVEVIGADGNWVALAGEWPKPAEFERTYMLDLTGKFPTDDYRVRLTFLLKTYVDAVQLDTTPDTPLDITELPLDSAVLQHHGWDPHTSDGDIYEFAYGEPNDSKGFFPGDYTRYGDVTPLLGATDDMFAIFGGGDEVVLRFDQAGAVPEGMTRRYVVYANGYYKDLYSDVPKSVEPLPFAAMSNYPYKATESYPIDPEHQAYRAEYNTRRYSFEMQEQSAVSVMSIEIPSLIELVLGDAVDAAALAQSTAVIDEPGDAYSVDTNQAYARVTQLDGSVVNVPLSAAWESVSLLTAGPSPTSPGTPVAAGRLPAASARDSSWLRTDLTTTNLQANWQLLRFDMPMPSWSVRSIALVWYGHGEPTTTYETKVDVWNPGTSTWTQLRNAVTPTDLEVVSATSDGLGTSGMCLRCHDGTPPAGVTFPATPTYRNMSDWGLATGDYHGARVGVASWWATLRPGYTRGSQLACSTCHQSHGSASIYHFPSVIGGQPVATVTSGTNTETLCAACHAGSIYNYHGGCTECHGVWEHEGYVRDLNVVLADCYSCHRHGGTWTHTNYCWGGCNDHGATPPSADRTF